MSLPQHWMNLYHKPKISTTFIAKMPVFKYKHKISAMGWYDNASFEVAIRPEKAQEFLEQYLGNRISIYVDSWPEAIWEGLIYRMSINIDGVEFSISLEEMANQVVIQYSNTGATGAPPAATTGANNTPSILTYGVKRRSFDMGPQRVVAATGINAYRDTLVTRLAWPKTSQRQGGSNSLVRIEARGVYHTLTWDTYRESTTSSSALNTFLTSFLLPALQNGSTFFSVTDFTEIVANALTIGREKVREVPFWDVFQEVAEVGNASDYYIIGVTPTNRNTGIRRVYYRPANFEIEYFAKRREGLMLYTPYGRRVPPWAVKPDRVVRVVDELVGWNGQGDDPATTYIQTVEYDGDQQTARWSGDDDTTAEGVMQIKRYGKSTNTRYGARRLN